MNFSDILNAPLSDQHFNTYSTARGAFTHCLLLLLLLSLRMHLCVCTCVRVCSSETSQARDIQLLHVFTALRATRPHAAAPLKSNTFGASFCRQPPQPVSLCGSPAVQRKSRRVRPASDDAFSVTLNSGPSACNILKLLSAQRRVM